MNAKFVVYVIDADAGFRRDLVLVLRKKGFQPVPFSSGPDFLDSLDFLQSGIVLLELHMPVMDGIEVQERLLERRVDMPVIIMARDAELQTAVQAIKKGATDFIEKPFTFALLMEMLDSAIGQLDKQTEVQSRRDDAASRVNHLSARELDVMRGLLAGLTNKALARELNLSPRTVEMHRANMMKKIGVKKLSEAIQIAMDAEINSPFASNGQVAHHR